MAEEAYEEELHLLALMKKLFTMGVVCCSVVWAGFNVCSTVWDWGKAKYETHKQQSHTEKRYLRRMKSLVASYNALESQVAKNDRRLTEIEGTMTSKSVGRTSNSSKVKLWPSNTIRYHIDEKIEDWDLTQMIDEAFEKISENTCLKFHKLPILWKDRSSFLLITLTESDEDYPNATLGYSQRNQVELSMYSEFDTVYHEFLHALGLPHEHQRPDAEIVVNFDNLEGDSTWYRKYPKDMYPYPLDKFIFDADSIMAYCSYSETTQRGKKTINYGRAQGSLSPTPIDYMKINCMYCGSNPPPKETQWYMALLNRYSHKGSPKKLKVVIEGEDGERDVLVTLDEMASFGNKKEY